MARVDAEDRRFDTPKGIRRSPSFRGSGDSDRFGRFTEWVEAGVFYEFWRQGLLSYDGLVGTDWVAIGRRSDDQGSVGRGKKPAPTRPTGASWGPSARW